MTVAELQTGYELGRYEVLRLLAQGGFGSIYEARDRSLDRVVVIKSLRPEAASNPSLRARFLHEGRIAARIHHPNVVQIFESIDGEDGAAYLVMEKLVGVDLAAQVDQSGFLAVDAICDILLPICAAVAFAHDQGVLHRDIKPGNIFLATTPDGELVPKLLDFGISKVLDNEAHELHTSTGTVLGSPRYMAPEQFVQRAKLDRRVDVYALGAVLYRCATRAMPYQHPGDPADVSILDVVARITTRNLVAPNVWRPDLPAAFGGVIAKAMAYDRAERHASARDLGAALLPFCSEWARARWTRVFLATTEAPPVTPSPENSPPVERKRTESSGVRMTQAPRRRALVPWLLVALTMVMVATIAGVVVRRRRAPPLLATPPSQHVAPPSPPVAPPEPERTTTVEAPAPLLVGAPEAVAPPPRTMETPEVLPPETQPAARAVRSTPRSTSRPVRRRPSPAAGRRCANGADCDL